MQFHRLAIAGAIAATLSLYAQSADSTAKLQFEVASLKPTPADSTDGGQIKRLPGDRGYFGTNMPLLSYLTVAYQVRPAQISGADGMLADHYDLNAKAERASTVDELHVMLQHLLEERFHMKLRREAREQPGFALVVDKDGPKLKDHDPADKVLLPIPPGSGRHTGTNVTMTYLAFYLSQELDRTVVDKTGLEGHYDFEATWVSDRSGGPMMIPPAPPGAAGMPMEMREASMPTGPTLPDALRQQLGLRLDPIKVPAEHLVIEHIEKLSEN